MHIHMYPATSICPISGVFSIDSNSDRSKPTTTLCNMRMTSANGCNY